MKPMHLIEGQQYTYSGGAVVEDVIYKGMAENNYHRLFEFVDSHNSLSLGNGDIQKYRHVTEEEEE